MVAFSENIVPFLTFKLYLVALWPCFCTMDLPDHDIHKYLVYALYYFHLNVIYTLLLATPTFLHFLHMEEVVARVTYIFILFFFS